MKGLYHGDCIEVMRSLPENSVDTCITDPPYGLRFMGKEWDTFRQDKRGKNQIINMGNGMKQLNHIELVEFQEWTTQWAQAVYRLLKPGGLLLAFGGTRTYHRMVCAIEDAGFEIRDMIEWVYGSGFPKSYDIGKGIDKQAGAKREVVGKYQYPDGNERNLENCVVRNATSIDMRNDNLTRMDITAPSTPEAQLWDGWGTALKPAHEPIVVAMKPLDGGFVNNALTWGVAGYWIDGGRVGTEGGETHSGGWQDTMVGGKVINGGVKADYTPQGRFPANFIHDGSDEVLEVFPQTKSGLLAQGHKRGDGTGNSFMCGGGIVYRDYGNDSGSAARFFYCAKASRSERNAGLEGMPEKQIGLGRNGVGENKSGGISSPQTNAHPTVKPIELMRYLVRLTKTPTGGVVLDPFMGSGTTGCACALEGREFIGIEREQEYIEIAEKWIAYWAMQPGLVEAQKLG